MSKAVDEDLIEATIRRVAASKAARTTESAEPSRDDGDVPDASDGGPELHVVPSASDEPEAEPPPLAARPPVDETLIEATLRRIEAEQAARAVQADVAPGGGVEQSADEAMPTDVAIVPLPAFDLPASDAPWADAMRELRRELEDTRRQLQTLAARVDAALSPPARETLRSAPQATQPDDDWDDTPQLPHVAIGTPPRPGIVREPPPPMASAARRSDAGVGAESASAAVPPPVAPKRGLELLARTYRITVEDRRRGVDLVPLHRALLGIDGVRDISLLSYSNGTAIVALEATGEIAPDVLGAAVSRAMARELKVEVHNEQTMVIKLAED
jgi:hypothetical protein